MGEWRLFPAGTIPEYTTPAWYAGRERAPHLEQGGGHTERLHEAAMQVVLAADMYGLGTVSDLGAGDGGLLSLINDSVPAAWGYDLQQTNVDGAVNDRKVSVYLGDVIEGVELLGVQDGVMQKIPIEWGEISVATEMLEHLVDPHAFVRTIAEHSRILIASSPWGERPGAAYEFHTWAWDQDGYRVLLECGGFQVVKQELRGGFQILTGVAH